MTSSKSASENPQVAVLISETVLDLITVARAGLDQAEGFAKNPEAMAAALDTAGFLLVEFLKEVRGLVGVLAKAVGSNDVNVSPPSHSDPVATPPAQTSSTIDFETTEMFDDVLADIVDLRAV